MVIVDVGGVGHHLKELVNDLSLLLGVCLVLLEVVGFRPTRPLHVNQLCHRTTHYFASRFSWCGWQPCSNRCMPISIRVSGQLSSCRFDKPTCRFLSQTCGIFKPILVMSGSESAPDLGPPWSSSCSLEINAEWKSEKCQRLNLKQKTFFVG